jgi:hypothetical protein
MKSEIERRRHRRAVNALGRLVFTAVGPLTLSLLFAAYSPPAHATRCAGANGGVGGNAAATCHEPSRWRPARGNQST